LIVQQSLDDRDRFRATALFIKGSIVLVVLFVRAMVFFVKILFVVAVAVAASIAVAYKKRQAARTAGP
jgi:nicotinamide riboside transporter PnuC